VSLRELLFIKKLKKKVKTLYKQKEYVMGDKGGQKDKDRNKKKMLKKREDKATKSREKNQTPIHKNKGKNNENKA